MLYLPHERHILPFFGERGKDGRSVEDFVKEVERALRVRELSVEE